MYASTEFVPTESLSSVTENFLLQQILNTLLPMKLLAHINVNLHLWLQQIGEQLTEARSLAVTAAS